MTSTHAWADQVSPTKWWQSSVNGKGPGPNNTYSSAAEACAAAVYIFIDTPLLSKDCHFTGMLTPINNGDGMYCSGTCMYIDRSYNPPRGDSWSGSGFGVVGSILFCPKGTWQDPSDPRSETSCIGTEKGKGCPDCPAGNPINAATGNKWQLETDYRGSGAFPLEFKRGYNSFGNTPGNKMRDWYYSPQNTATDSDPNKTKKGWIQFFCNPYRIDCNRLNTAEVGTFLGQVFDANWRINFERSLLNVTSAFLNTATVMGANSEVVEFTLKNGVWTPDADNISLKLIDIKDGSGKLLSWQYTNAKEEIETYNALGKLLEIKNKYGLVHTMHYNVQGQLDTVTDTFGRQLSFTYDGQGKLSVMTDPALATYNYTYDAVGNLSTVTYPGGRTRTYVFEDSRFPSGLTGIIDENGARFATWSYDEDGRAISSEHAGGVEKVTVSFGAHTSSVLDAQGMTLVYNTALVNGINMPLTVTENCGENCTRSQTMTYDTSSNKTSHTDWNGNLTTYTYDLARNLETSRTEAVGTTQARTITTAWHPSYRIPTQINEPLRKTTYTYDAKGNVLTKTEQATVDTNGSQGAAATVTGTARVWKYTYNSYGQVFTSTGPRTDIVDKTTYAYDTLGNLATVTNAMGHLTTLSNYDAHGHVGRISDPNGVLTDLRYTPRGWLETRTVTADGTSEVTSYTYDGVGQLKKINLPDNSVISYTYDDAHRLTQINDALGNSVTYTLDNMGNRIKEEIKDPTGHLTRQSTRIIDALNRVQQITGGAQ